MYYDGEIHMFRSCVSSLISGVNEYYNWFSCNKIPSDVIIKYAMRGISTILNKKEIKTIISYIKSNKEWKKLFDYININPKNLCCIINENHILFNLPNNVIGIRYGLKNIERRIIYNNKIFNDILYFNNELKIKNNKQIFEPNINLIKNKLKKINDNTY
jgi:hypothetical protein